MKRCRSDELQQPEEDPGAAGESPGHGVMEGKAGEAAAAPEAGAVPPPPRSKPPDLKGLRKSREFRAGSREGRSGRIREDPGLRHRE
ncbi:hypothetical protein TURU_000445 [Turdus rufiventris]|nr:hypothetical protein TURU_000445 [Turdus rufiventris]